MYEAVKERELEASEMEPRGRREWQCVKGLQGCVRENRKEYGVEG